MTKRTSGLNPEWVAGNNFIMLHLDLVDDLDGDFHAALLLARIQFRAGTDGWWPATYEELCADTRMTLWTLKRSINLLRDRGYIESERAGGYDATTQWRVVIRPEKTAMTDMSGDDQCISRETTSPLVGRRPVDRSESAISLSTKNSEELSKNPPISPHPFDEFWKAYPRKRDKGHAEKAWTKAVKETDPAVIISAVVQFRQWCEQENTEAQFIPHAATWLNGKRWLDERDPQPISNVQAHLALIEEMVDNDAQGYPQLEG